MTGHSQVIPLAWCYLFRFEYYRVVGLVLVICNGDLKGTIR